MSVYELKLVEFKFPRNLPNSRANFRIVFDVRYTETTEKGKTKITTVQSLKPGADTFWECDMDRDKKPNYARAKDKSEISFEAVNDWDQTVLLLTTDTILGVRAKVFDVDREGFWDKVADKVGNLVEAAMGVAKGAMGGVLPAFTTSVSGSAVDELSSYAVKKIAGGGDKVLFQGSAEKKDNKIKITGNGSDGKKGKGQYTVGLQMTQLS